MDVLGSGGTGGGTSFKGKMVLLLRLVSIGHTANLGHWGFSRGSHLHSVPLCPSRSPQQLCAYVCVHGHVCTYRCTVHMCKCPCGPEATAKCFPWSHATLVFEALNLELTYSGGLAGTELLWSSRLPL